MTVMIGVDPHKGSHTAVVVDSGERSLDELRRASVSWMCRSPSRRCVSQAQRRCPSRIMPRLCCCRQRPGA